MEQSIEEKFEILRKEHKRLEKMIVDLTEVIRKLPNPNEPPVREENTPVNNEIKPPQPKSTGGGGARAFFLRDYTPERYPGFEGASAGEIFDKYVKAKNQSFMALVRERSKVHN